MLRRRRRIRHQALRPGRAQHAAPGSQDGALRPRDRRLHHAARSRPGLDRQDGQGRVRRPRRAGEAEGSRASRASWSGFEMRGRGIGRDGYEVWLDGAPAGWVTSGSPSPTLNKNIGLVLSAGRARAAGPDDSDHDPQPAGGCGDGGNSFLQTSEMNMYPENFRYTKEHEWVLVEGDTGTIGITDHAQEELGDIVYVDLPESRATQSKQGKSLGSVESVKAVSDIYSPVSGEVIGSQPVAGRRARKAERGSARRGLAGQDPAERSRRDCRICCPPPIIKVYRSGKVVALSSEVRIRAPRDAGRLRRECPEDLFAHLPEAVRLKRPLDLAPGISEYEIVDYFRAARRENANGYAQFPGRRRVSTITVRCWWIRWSRAASF